MGKHISTNINEWLNENDAISMEQIQDAIDNEGLILAKTDQKLNPWFSPVRIDGDIIWATDSDGKEHELKLEDVEDIKLSENLSPGHADTINDILDYLKNHEMENVACIKVGKFLEKHWDGIYDDGGISPHLQKEFEDETGLNGEDFDNVNNTVATFVA